MPICKKTKKIPFLHSKNELKMFKTQNLPITRPKVDVVSICKKTRKFFLGRFPCLATILLKMPFLHSKNELKMFNIQNLPIMRPKVVNE